LQAAFGAMTMDHGLRMANAQDSRLQIGAAMQPLRACQPAVILF
jgi:hypothetical protein